MIVIFKVIVNIDIIYDIIFVRQKYDIGQIYNNIRPNLLDLSALVRQSLSWGKLCQYSLQNDDLILEGAALGICKPLPVPTSSSC